MKTELEATDIEAIVDRVIERLKPLMSNNQKEVDTIFDKKGLAEYLSVSVKWVDGYKSLGMPYYILKGHVRFRKSDIDAWLESRKVPAIDRMKKIMKIVR